MNSHQSYPDSETSPRAFAAVWRVWWRASATLLILGLLVIVCSPKQFLASAQLKMEFVSTNGVALNPEDYAASGYGWSPLATEARTVCSDLFLSKAQELRKLRIPKATPLAIPRDQLGYGYIPRGIRLLIVGDERGATEELCDALAEVYRDCRHQLLPAPPGCQALRVSIAQPARGSSSLMYADRLLKAVLVALFFGLAVAVLVRRNRLQSESTLLPNFLCFFGFLYSAGLLFTPLEFTVLLVGASFLALLLASAVAAVDIVAGLNSPLPRRFLKFTFLSIAAVWVVTGFSGLFQHSERLRTNSQVRISVEQPGVLGELPINYDPRFVETECALICSGQFLDQFIDRWQLQAALKSTWGGSLRASDVPRILSRCVAPKAVRQTSMMNITYSSFAKGTQTLNASNVVESYQTFWRSRSETNSSRRVAITGLNFADSSSKRSVLKWSNFGRTLSSNLLEALMALAGVLCFALLARNPARLQTIPLFAVPYLIALGIGWVGDELEVPTPTASALVRIWPSDTERAEPAAEVSPDARPPLLHRERERALSDEVLDETMRALGENHVMTQSGRKDRWQTRAWLKEHLEVIALEDTFLLIFRAAHDDAAVAIELANAGAKAYCQVRSSGADKLEAEVFDRASSAAAMRNPNPLKASLSSTTSSALFFLLGTGLAYGGFIFERVQRSKTV